MKELNETNRVYSYPTKINKIGDDLVLTGKYFFVILSSEDVKRIQEEVIIGNKNIMLQCDKLIVYMKDNYVVIEQLNENNFNRFLLINPSNFS